MLEEEKTYTFSDIISIYTNLSAEEQVEVLMGALDYMSQSNTRSKYYCIVLELGFEYADEDENLYRKRA